MLRKTACFFLKIAYASRLMTLCVLPIEEAIEKLNEAHQNFFQKNQNFFQKPLDKIKKMCYNKGTKERNQQKMFGDFRGKQREDGPMDN